MIVARRQRALAAGPSNGSRLLVIDQRNSGGLQQYTSLNGHHFSAMKKLFQFCDALDRLHVRYGMLAARDDAVMVTVVVPGQYVEIEFFTDGSVEIERFLSQGVEEASDAQLEELIKAFPS